MFMKGRERRYKIMHLTPEIVMSMVINPVRIGQEVKAISVKGIPDEVAIDAVIWSEERRAFVFRLWHESFAVVPENAIIPEIDAEFSVQHLLIAENQNGRRWL